MTTATSTSAPAASASASSSSSSSSSSSFNPFKRRAQQKEGSSSSSSAIEEGGTSKKSHRPRTMQQPRAPDRPPPPPRGAQIRNRAGSATATTGMSHQQAHTPQRSTPAPSIATTTTTTPAPLPRRTPTPPPPPSSSSDPITQAHSSLSALQTQLDHLSAHLDLNPSTWYFSPPSPSNTDPKLPFVPQNATYHSYIEDLTKLLLKLDGIDSNGDPGVRQRRKGLVAAIEKELEKVEATKKGEWGRRQKVEQELSERKSKVDEMMRGGFRGGEPATTSR